MKRHISVPRGNGARFDYGHTRFDRQLYLKSQRVRITNTSRPLKYSYGPLRIDGHKGSIVKAAPTVTTIAHTFVLRKRYIKSWLDSDSLLLS